MTISGSLPPDDGIEVDRVLETPTARVVLGRRSGEPVALKSYRRTEDARRTADVLDAFGGRGMVRLIERRSDALLIERVKPGTPLSALVDSGVDDEATRVLARTIRQMRPDRIPDGVPAVATLGEGFSRYIASGDVHLPATTVRTAAALYFQLCESQTRVRLLHGDLHHDNLLLDAGRGWIAIDPKGVIGEVEYELAVSLRNPIQRPDVFGDPRVFERRVDQFARELAVNAERVKKWAYATAVLAAIWTIEDREDAGVRDRWIAFAGMTIT